MRLYEKFLLEENGNKYVFPAITDSGVLGYEIEESNTRKIFFVAFNSLSQKNNFIKYNVKYYELKSDSFQMNYMITKNDEVDYSNYFNFIFSIKNNIRKESYFIPSCDRQFFCLIWKSFVIAKEDWFSKHYGKFPVRLLETIDTNLDVEEKSKKINMLISFLNTDYNNMYAHWVSHKSSLDNLPFLNWFADFVES